MTIEPHSVLYLLHYTILHLLLLLKQLNPFLELFLEMEQVRCVCFLSGLAAFSLGLWFHLQKP